MNDLITSISLVVNAILIVWIIYNQYQDTRRQSFSNTLVQGLIDNVPEAERASVIDAFGRLLGRIASENSENTRQISVGQANTLHRYFLNQRSLNNVDTTRAVMFSMPVLLRAIYDGSVENGIVNSSLFTNNMLNSSFYAYLAKYDNDYSSRPNGPIDHPKDQSTVIIQLANGDSGEVLPNQIYNFGKLCPTMCPPNGQIVPQ